jgi:hypothetical protein
MLDRIGADIRAHRRLGAFSLIFSVTQ